LTYQAEIVIIIKIQRRDIINMFAKRHYREEAGYLDMMRDILAYGCRVPDRTGHDRIKLFSCTLEYDLSQGLAASTVRNAPPRFSFEEYWAFLNGVVFIHPYLSAKGIDIWEGNTTREFLDGRKLTFLPVGHMGKAYGFQYAHFNGVYDENFNPTGGVDQIKNVFEQLRVNPFSSRHVVSIWNPSQEAEMALPPCWWAHEFVVTLNAKGEKVLNLQAISRSADVLFGTPFNVSQFSIYLCAMADALGYKRGLLSCLLIDAHLYGSQVKYVEETLTREFSGDKPTITFNKPMKTVEDLRALTWKDIVIGEFQVNKTPYIEKRPKMAV
jgi:thymidylate synthase